MKTATITLHDTGNCGSSLQAYALQVFLHRNSIQNEIIDYMPAYAKNNGHPLKTFARKVFFLPASLRQFKKMRVFKKQHLSVTAKRYKTRQQLCSDPPLADCYITGSDQLWNTMYPCGRDPAFYLDFAKGKKVGYAISMGRETIPPDNLARVHRCAADFAALSVRERSSVNELKEVFPGPIEYVCDPVLLNPPHTYDSLRADRLCRQPYILVYVAQKISPGTLNHWIETINQDKERKVVFIGSFRPKCRCDIHIRDIAPGEFLSLIYYADYVISNSFHATLFSLLYHRQFATIMPPKNSARMKSILQDVGLGDHCVQDGSQVPPNISQQQFQSVDAKVQAFREHSANWLLNALGITQQVETAT